MTIKHPQNLKKVRQLYDDNLLPEYERALLRLYGSVLTSKLRMSDRFKMDIAKLILERGFGPRLAGLAMDVPAVWRLGFSYMIRHQAGTFLGVLKNYTPLELVFNPYNNVSADSTPGELILSRAGFLSAVFADFPGHKNPDVDFFENAKEAASPKVEIDLAGVLRDEIQRRTKTKIKLEDAPLTQLDLEDDPE